MKKLLIFGAGPIGRMLAQVFAKEYRTVFVDIDQKLIHTLNSQKEFGITILGNSSIQEIDVTHVSAIIGTDTESICNHLCDAELVLTAVGINSLKFIAPNIARGLEYRLKKRGDVPLFIVACENATEQNSSLLKELILQSTHESLISRLENLVYAPDCMIDRVSLVPTEQVLFSDTLAVKVEEYFQLSIQKMELDFPYIPSGVTIVNNLEPIKKQKLFTVNATHALIAYYGAHFGYEYIHNSINDQRVASLVNGVLEEIKIATSSYGILESEQDIFSEKVIDRFKNSNLMDPIVRVARDSPRKAGNTERFISSAKIVQEKGLVPSYLASGLAALYLYNNSQDEQSKIIANDIKKMGFQETVYKYSGLRKEEALFMLIEPAYYMGTSS